MTQNQLDYVVIELDCEQIIILGVNEMNSHDHIKRLFSILSAALSLIALILLFYGAWLHDNGLATKAQIFQTVLIPVIGSIVALYKAR